MSSGAAATAVATRTLRLRLVASLAIAGLVPFAAAWWISSAYETGREVERAGERLAFTIEAALGEAEKVRLDARRQALRLARDRRLQLALLRGDRKGLAQLLRVREAVALTGGSAVGDLRPGATAARVEVGSGDRRLGTVVVAVPAGDELLREISPLPTAVGATEIALARSGTIATGPLAGTRLGTGATVDHDGTVYRVRSATLPGFPIATRVVALADGRSLDDALAHLRQRLLLGGAVSLAAVTLLALALGRPLLQGLGRVERVARQATVDSLTGLANRRGFEQALALELERCARYGHVCSVAVADLDDFKRVNDRHGHAVGDEALRAFAGVLTEATRSVDLAARLGGEEFAVLMPETDADSARRLAERVRAALERSRIPTPSGDLLQLTASLGVAGTSTAGAAAVLLRQADGALYAAKRAGKNRVVLGDAAHAAGQQQPVGTAPGPPAGHR